MSFPWGHVLGMGVRKSFFANRKAFRQMATSDPVFRDGWRDLMRSVHKPVAYIDEVAAPYMVRNEGEYPFATRIGFRDGEHYWSDASSYGHLTNVAVPLLKVTALDDFLVSRVSAEKIGFALRNPNVIWVKTKTGGHLGWFQEEGGSWANGVVCDFIQAILKMRQIGRLDGQPRDEAQNDHVNFIIRGRDDATELNDRFNHTVKSRL
mmetsp:Transcript_63357/g.74949  ORF Transcript_63357/g.74949 Transcript_63357/m.74949 type:complete len:207 (+) Transcript_63357:710-1330(+)